MACVFEEARAEVTTELFGLTLDGDVDTGHIPTAIVVVLELINEDGEPYLRLISNNLSVWQRIGMMRCVIASDEAEAAVSFKEDEK